MLIIDSKEDGGEFAPVGLRKKPSSLQGTLSSDGGDFFISVYKHIFCNRLTNDLDVGSSPTPRRGGP